MVPSKEDLREYFLKKQKQYRKRVADLSGLGLAILSMAIKIYELHHPYHPVGTSTKACRFYWNTPEFFNNSEKIRIATVYFIRHNLGSKVMGYTNYSGNESDSFVVEIKVGSYFRDIDISWADLASSDPLIAGKTTIVNPLMK